MIIEVIIDWVAHFENFFFDKSAYFVGKNLVVSSV